MSKRKKLEGRYICKCECGGQVRGIEDFGRLFTWCEKCTPVEVMNKEPSAKWLKCSTKTAGQWL